VQTNTIPDVLVVDRGPVCDAARCIAEDSTLSEHVTVTPGDWTTEIRITSDIPFDLWGSGTEALWRLVCAIAYSRHEVSLYEVASRLDIRNSTVVASALAALFGGAR